MVVIIFLLQKINSDQHTYYEFDKYNNETGRIVKIIDGKYYIGQIFGNIFYKQCQKKEEETIIFQKDNTYVIQKYGYTIKINNNDIYLLSKGTISNIEFDNSAKIIPSKLPLSIQ